MSHFRTLTVVVEIPDESVLRYPGSASEATRLALEGAGFQAVSVRNEPNPTGDMRETGSAVHRLERSNAELTAALNDTRERMRAAEAELAAIGSMRVVEHEGRGLKVITSAMHDRLCKAKVGTPQGTTPEVLHCALCGYCYPPVKQEGAGR